MLAASAASAQERLWLAGTELAPGSSYSYAGLLMPAFGGHLGEGFIQRYWVDYLTYRYDSDGRRIEAEGLGAEAALGYVTPVGSGQLSTTMGILYRDTTLSPDDPDSAARGAQWRLRAQVEYNQPVSESAELGLLGSYVFGQRGYWTRARLGMDVGPGLRAGPELILQGDPDYRAVQYGAFLAGLQLSSTVQAGIRAGIREQRDESRRGYVGVEFTGHW
ncbi:hypothetical protein B1C78_02005 [Thioalkalivibrio denitrificans]|uniref:Cellulose biosynthesis protein BcsS n=1 Tax=Thioalkalivibrio denitrificans TaxID=108003 RepID=A0A1V3NT29_9GAMM|nr:hypothetical protein B1C78_02005 [Thioalkalivibrio denitrificans]